MQPSDVTCFPDGMKNILKSKSKSVEDHHFEDATKSTESRVSEDVYHISTAKEELLKKNVHGKTELPELLANQIPIITPEEENCIEIRNIEEIPADAEDCDIHGLHHGATFSSIEIAASEIIRRSSTCMIDTGEKEALKLEGIIKPGYVEDVRQEVIHSSSIADFADNDDSTEKVLKSEIISVGSLHLDDITLIDFSDSTAPTIFSAIGETFTKDSRRSISETLCSKSGSVEGKSPEDANLHSFAKLPQDAISSHTVNLLEYTLRGETVEDNIKFKSSGLPSKREDMSRALNDVKPSGVTTWPHSHISFVTLNFQTNIDMYVISNDKIDTIYLQAKNEPDARLEDDISSTFATLSQYDFCFAGEDYSMDTEYNGKSKTRLQIRNKPYIIDGISSEDDKTFVDVPLDAVSSDSEYTHRIVDDLRINQIL